jgi:hypothetical protein
MLLLLLLLCDQLLLMMLLLCVHALHRGALCTHLLLFERVISWPEGIPLRRPAKSWGSNTQEHMYVNDALEAVGSCLGHSV